MRSISIKALALLPLLLGSAFAAPSKVNPLTQIDWTKLTGTVAPTTGCTSTTYGMPYTNTTNGNFYVCASSGWVLVSGGSLTGSGTTNNIAKFTGASALGNSSITDNGTIIAAGEPVQVNDGSGKAGALSLAQGTAPTAAAANNIQIDAPTSVTAYDIVLPGAQPADSSHTLISCTPANPSVCSFASAGTGTVTTTGSPASGNLTKFSGATSITNGDLSGDVTTSGTLATTLASTAVTPGSYTSTNLTVDAKWRITAASNGSGTTVSVNGSSVSSPNFNGTTPAAGSNGKNVTWQTSSSSVSAEVVGDGTATHYLDGTGNYSTPAGTGSSGAWVNITGSSQVTAAGCTQSSSTGGTCKVSGTSTTTVTFSSIPQGYTNLQLVSYGGTSTSATIQGSLATFNSDSTAAHYGYAGMYSSNGAVADTSGTSTGFCVANAWGNPGTGGGIMTIYGYSDTNFQKISDITSNYLDVVTSLTHVYIAKRSCLWNQTSAITRIDLLQSGALNYANGTTFMLFGQQ